MPEVTDELLDKDGIIYTDCSQCGFAKFDQLGLTQTGCELHRLNKFRNMGLTEAQEKDGVQSYKITTVCNTMRPKEWVAEKSNPIQEVLKEVKINVDVILVYEGGGSEEDLEHNLLKSIGDVNKQKQKPEKVIFVLPNNVPISFMEINTIIKDSLLCKYELVRVFEPLYTRTSLADLGIRKTVSLYYTIFSLGYPINKYHLRNINRAITIDLKRFLIVKSSDNFNGLVVQRLVHNMVEGHKGGPVWEKVEELAKLQDNTEMVKNWEEVFN